MADNKHTSKRLVKRGEGLFARFCRARDGASAVEFAIIAPLFFGLAFAILEAGIYFFISSAVDAANAKAARLIRTGQTQGGAINREAFFDEVCEVVSLFGDCTEKLTVDVERFNSFAALTADDPVCRDSDPSKGEPDPDDRPYNTGAARDIVRVRVCFLYKNFTPVLNPGLRLETTGGGAHKMISTVIFRNEPFASP